MPRAPRSPTDRRRHARAGQYEQHHRIARQRLRRRPAKRPRRPPTLIESSRRAEIADRCRPDGKHRWPAASASAPAPASLADVAARHRHVPPPAAPTGVGRRHQGGSPAHIFRPAGRRNRPARTAVALWNASYCGLAVWACARSGCRDRRRRRRERHLRQFCRHALPLPAVVLRLARRRRGVDGRGARVLRRKIARRYADEAKETLALTWALWIPIHCLTFSVVPVPLRTHFVAACSFCTLTCMSFLQASLERRR